MMAATSSRRSCAHTHRGAGRHEDGEASREGRCLAVTILREACITRGKRCACPAAHPTPASPRPSCHAASSVCGLNRHRTCLHRPTAGSHVPPSPPLQHNRVSRTCLTSKTLSSRSLSSGVNLDTALPLLGRSRLRQQQGRSTTATAALKGLGKDRPRSAPAALRYLCAWERRQATHSLTACGRFPSQN